MPLIKSISGIRGTIGGKPGNSLSPVDIVKFTSAYATWLKNQNKKNNYNVVVGRDARISGAFVMQLVTNTLVSCGINVIDLNLSTTPTVEFAVLQHNADGGIIITASHNPVEWNALKLLNNKGEFLNAEDGKQLLDIADADSFSFSSVEKLGNITTDVTALDKHIEAVVQYSLVDATLIKKKKFKIVIDGINSTGATAVPAL
ncbi:MAG TPA: phosphoglucosamine mutase, partial [Parafilimonas sp.]|nr:phosphoglucosamine mutase [Parafilimonas sp.]